MHLMLVALLLGAASDTDDLCRVTGETAQVALQPKDRLFLEKSCVCYEEVGCAAKKSPRAKELASRRAELDAAQAEKKAKLYEAEHRACIAAVNCQKDGTSCSFRARYFRDACIVRRGADCSKYFVAVMNGEATCD